jgi:hypothetical protein
MTIYGKKDHKDDKNDRKSSPPRPNTNSSFLKIERII